MTATVEDSAAELMRGEMHLPGLHLRLLQDTLHLGGLQLPSTCSITHIFLKVHTPTSSVWIKSANKKMDGYKGLLGIC